ncbi:MAG TPA: M4 family metallopeptidase [Pyrinomonadaceae bacterium]
MTTTKTTKKSSTKASSKKGAAAAGAFSTFAMHRADESHAPTFAALREERLGFAGFALAADAVNNLDPETAARHYLEQALASDSVPSLTAPKSDGPRTEFKALGTETLHFANTKTVKFRQFYNKIPVYSSLVTVELDEQNECLSINSTLGGPSGVSAVAKVSPAAAVKKALKAARVKPPWVPPPRLNYYYDRKACRWRLTYIIEDVPINRSKRGAKASLKGAQPPKGIAPFFVDYIIDAHTGMVVAELSRTHTMALPEEEDALDDFDRPRRIRFTLQANGKVLRDSQLNLLTHDFRFGDPQVTAPLLPGGQITNPPAPWAAGAVSAHANAAKVAMFLRQVLQRNNIDNQGGPIVSSVNCVIAAESPDGRQWARAIWTGRQMVYGQVVRGLRLRSFAASLDIVAHELFHGITENTSRLELSFQPGALNESYSDIFAILVSNIDQPNITNWNFQIGEGFASDGGPLRIFSRPSLRGQPEHMSQFRVLPNTNNGDFGGIHINCGIHNLAAFKIITARDAQGRFLFTPPQLAAIFYITLTQHLTRQSDFSASRRGVLLAARTLFRNDPPTSLTAKVAAIEKGFNDVGIPSA